jgi:transcriptional regulator with XRE-family HTH domain
MASQSGLSARSLLGDLLRAARLEAGYRTQEALGEALGMDQTGVNKAETGDRIPSARILGDWLGLCNVSGIARQAIEGVAELARATAEDAPVKVWFSGYLTAEASAHSIRIWQPSIVPGLVQTDAYARVIFEVAGIDDARIRELLEVRQKRREIFARPQPPNVVLLLDESVLHRPIGPPQVMREQLEHIMSLPKSVVVQVIPACNAGLGGAITLLTGPGGPEMLLAEALIEDQVTTDATLVIRASATFDAVRADAHARSQSRTMITEAIQQWSN